MILKAGSPVELTERVLQILNENEVTTVEQFLKKDPHSLPLDTKLVLHLQTKIYSKYVLEPRTGSYLYERAIKNSAIVSTGNRTVDQKLGGGFYTGEHVDICGDSNVRSDFLLQCMSELLRTDANATIIYIDTESHFQPEKLISDFGCDSGQLKRIQVVFPTDFSEMLTFLDQVHVGRLRPKLIVINAFVDTVKAFMIGNDPIATLGLLNHIAATIRSIAEHLKLSLLTTNDLGQNGPALGRMWLAAPHLRIALKSLEEVLVLKSTRDLATTSTPQQLS